MIQTIVSGDRYHADHGWLSTYWHFSFSDYYDPGNMSWGALRVFNDDVIRGGGIFDMHPHRDMEIVTYVLEGQLEHRDNLGHRGIIGPGEIQIMSAGRGITHSEANASQSDDVHLLQLWIQPRTAGLKPRWEQRAFTADQRRGKLLAVVSSGQVHDTMSIDQDAVIYVSRLQPGQSAVHLSRPGRRAYLFVISGALTLNDKPLAAGDQARAKDETSLTLTASADTELILLDLP